MGASYATPPNEVKRAIARGGRQRAAGHAHAGSRRCVIKAFGGSAIDYLVAVLDRGLRHRPAGARPGAHQHLVHLPAPQHRDPVADPDPVRARRKSRCAPTRTSPRRPIGWAASTCSRRRPLEARHRLATAAAHHLFAAGEAIVRQDAEGRFDVRPAERPRARHPRAVGPGSGGDSGRRLLRRDVDADRRSPHRHRPRPRRHAGAGDFSARISASWRSPIPRCSITSRPSSRRAAPAWTRRALRGSGAWCPKRSRPSSRACASTCTSNPGPVRHLHPWHPAPKAP